MYEMTVILSLNSMSNIHKNDEKGDNWILTPSPDKERNWFHFEPSLRLNMPSVFKVIRKLSNYSRKAHSYFNTYCERAFYF